MAYVQLDDNGKVIGQFSLPQPCLVGYCEISDDDPRIAVAAVELVRTNALTTVISGAAAARNAWRTPGKDGVYLSKLADADAWEAAGRPDDLLYYPYLTAEVGITRTTAGELVALWRAMAAAWAQAAALIERIEMRAKAMLSVATSAEEIAGIMAGVEWPAP